MSIVIGCDSFLALKNVRNGDLGRWLNGHHVHVWVDSRQLLGSQASKPVGVELGCLEDFDPRQDARLERLMMKGCWARKCYYDPPTMWMEFLFSSYRHNQQRPWRRAASIGLAAGRLARYWLAGRAGREVLWRRDFAEALRRHPVAEVYRERLRNIDAEVVVSFSSDGLREMALIEAANSLGLPTAVMIRSRDNLASKIPYLPYADTYLVWSEITKQGLLTLYPEVPCEQVRVTGAPQFDRHLDATHRLPRRQFFDAIGLDPERPLVVYTMGVPGVIRHELDIAQHLADAAHAGVLAHGAQLLVRGHPRMFGSDIKLLRREYPDARSYPRPTAVPFGSATHGAQLQRLILEDEPVHLSLLAYQAVQVNVCGTMTIDSAIFDKPTVNVGYDVVEVPAAMSVRRFYKRSDTKQMMSYGASRLAQSPQECIDLINRYLKDPSLDAEGRARARREDCGPLGEAGKTIATILRELHQQCALRVA